MGRLCSRLSYDVTSWTFNQVLGCLSFFFFLLFFENLSIVVVVTLATASIAACLLFTSAEDDKIKSISQLNMLKLTFNSTVLKKKSK